MRTWPDSFKGTGRNIYSGKRLNVNTGDTFDPTSYSDKLIADLVSFIGREEFQTSFEKFFTKYAFEFTDDEEQALRYTEIYQEFCNLFEEQLVEFCASEGFL